jgi:hypothetical protein
MEAILLIKIKITEIRNITTWRINAFQLSYSKICNKQKVGINEAQRRKIKNNMFEKRFGLL